MNNPRTTARRRSDAAFSLAEIAIALFVMALGILAIVALFPAALEFGGSAMERAKASNLASSAESEIVTSGILDDLAGGAAAVWVDGGPLGNIYCYPTENVTQTDTGDQTYSWNALIFQGGGSYSVATDNVYYVQLRIYRSWPNRSTPVEIFELFLTR